jgi:teichuronic acid biosynthesis protein TuaE
MDLRAKLNLTGRDSTSRLLELSSGLLVGLISGGLLVFSGRLSSEWQGLIVLVIVAAPFILLIKDVERIVLAGIAIAFVLNLDVSLIISRYGITEASVASGQRGIVALTGLRVSLVLAFVVIGYVYWLIQPRDPDRKPIRFFSSVSVPALSFIFLNILSLLQAQDTQLSFFRIAQLIELFLMYFYLANHIRTKQDLQFFAVVLMGGMLAESVVIVVQWLTGWTFSMAGIEISIEDVQARRAAGTLGAVDAAGGIIAAQLAMVVAMACLFPKKAQQLFAIVCFSVGCIAMITTAVRAAWGSFIVVIFGFMLGGWLRGWVPRKSLIGLCLATLVLAAIFYPMISSRLTADDHGSAASRLLMFQLAWNVIQYSPAHLFLGVGANNYALVAPAYNTVAGGAMGNAIQNISVHNVYLLTWAEVGLPGLLCLLIFLAAPLVKVWQHTRSDDRFVSIVALGLGCALLAICIQMLSSPFVGRPINIYLWLLVALIASLDTLEARPAGSFSRKQV